VTSTRILGIAGGSGSGKTTLARALAQKLGNARILAQDSYYIDQSYRFDGDGGAVNFESSLAEPTPMYGYWEGSRWGRRLTVVGQEIEAQLAGANAEQQRQRDLANFFAGAREQIRYFKRTWTDGMADVEPQMGNIAEIAAAMYPKSEDQPPAPPAPSTT
jgi:ABC-type dipeptide/oligopeptide/nickel transport system ATPase component